MSKLSRLLAASMLTLAGCAAPAPPDYAAQYQPALDAHIGGWNGSNLDGLSAGIADNVQRRSSGGFSADSLEGLKKVMTDLRIGFPDAKVVLDESYFMKGLSFHLWTFTGTNTGPGTVPATGKASKVSGATLIRYNQDNKIVEELVYFDAADWYTQLGYTITPPATAEAPAAP
ncbi:MAG: ester cyclase [Burkholderiales bacterium]